MEPDPYKKEPYAVYNFTDLSFFIIACLFHGYLICGNEIPCTSAVDPRMLMKQQKKS